MQEQLQLNQIMIECPDVNKVMFQYIIQFGFVSFFSMVYPPVIIWCVFFNIVDIYFSMWAFGNHIKRKVCKEVKSLGFWNDAFKMMTFIALICNVLVLMFGSKSVYHLIGLDPELSESQWAVVLILFIAENVIFAVKYLILSLIDDKPGWVRSFDEQENMLREYDEKRELKAETAPPNMSPNVFKDQKQKTMLELGKAQERNAAK